VTEIFIYKKASRNSFIFFSLKRHSINSKTILACTESTDLILADFKQNFHLMTQFLHSSCPKRTEIKPEGEK
jgi:hypothetical protein